VSKKHSLKLREPKIGYLYSTQLAQDSAQSDAWPLLGHEVQYLPLCGGRPASHVASLWHATDWLCGASVFACDWL